METQRVPFNDMWEAIACEYLREIGIPQDWLQEPGYVDPFLRWEDDGGPSQ